MSLTTIKKLIKHEIFQIFVIYNYFNEKFRFFLIRDVIFQRL